MKFGKSIFKTFFLSLCIVANTSFAYAQTASILPPAKTTFFDQNGKPLTSGTVDFYVPGTTTRKTTWQDSAETIPNTNPVVLDAAGRAIILGDGAYRQIVKDRNSNLIWDQVTSSLGSGSGSATTIGDGLPVGTILPNSGFIAPANYQFAYGQTLNRSTYASLFAALTISSPIGCVGGSSLINVSDTSSLSVGTVLESICAAGSPTIISKTSSTVTLSANSTITVSTTGVFFPYGNGDALTTFNVPDMRGYVAAGRCNMGGVDCSVLNSTYFSSNSNNTPSGINAKGGSQSNLLAKANLPNYNLTVTDPGHTHSSSPDKGTSSTSGNIIYGGSANSGTFSFNTSLAFTGISVNSGGSGTPISLIQPTLTLNYVIKVLPDSNLTSSFGVGSIGGMTGIIACGSNVTCTGNTISFSFNGVNSIQGMTGNITCGTGLTCSASTISLTSVSASQTQTSRASAISTDLSAYTVITTLGYYSGGDGGGAVFKKVAGGTTFTDQYLAPGSYTPTTAGSGLTNGTYYGVPFTGGSGIGCFGQVVVAGGIATQMNISMPCAGYKAGDVITVPSNTYIGGAGTVPTYTIASIVTAKGSFTDSAGNLWQIVTDRGNFPNVKQFGAIGDWNGSDAGATNNLTSFVSAISYSLYPYSTSAALVNGNTLVVPKGGYMYCGGTLPIAPGIKLLGAGKFGGTTIAHCSADAVTVDGVYLCDIYAAVGQMGCVIEELSIIDQNSTNTSNTRAIYSTVAQQYPSIVNVYIQAVNKGCLTYDFGRGGASNFITKGVDCERTGLATSNHGVVIGSNVGGTIIVMKDWNFGMGGGAVSSGSYAINVLGGALFTDDVHIEEYPNGINIATTSANLLHSLKNMSIATSCTNGITMPATNPNNTVLVEMIMSSCTNATVLNGHAAGSNTTGNILLQKNYNP